MEALEQEIGGYSESATQKDQIQGNAQALYAHLPKNSFAPELHRLSQGADVSETDFPNLQKELSMIGQASRAMSGVFSAISNLLTSIGTYFQNKSNHMSLSTPPASQKGFLSGFSRQQSNKAAASTHTQEVKALATRRPFLGRSSEEF